MSHDIDIAQRVPLLARMSSDMEVRGSLRSSTATAMWAAYTAHTTVTAWSLIHRHLPVPLPRSVASVGGLALAAVGAALCGAGMDRFSGVRELTGTRNEALLTTGVYRYSRNPQYLGYIAMLGGIGVARRSGAVLLSTAALASVYSAWIPVEEKHLARMYGRTYGDYTRLTRRWWGRLH